MSSTSRRSCADASVQRPEAIGTHRENNSASWRECVSSGGAVYISPDPAPEGVRIWFFTRKGGVSEQPFDSLNVSIGVGDREEAVRRNLELVRSAMSGRSSAWARQVAGDGVKQVNGPGFTGEADALLTDRAGFSLVVGAADCVPVALTGGGFAGMVHSGWRGTISGISGKTIVRMREAGAGDVRMRAYIGPCIRGCCYEVSEELSERFVERFGDGVAQGRFLSLPDAVGRDLETAGAEVCDLGLCTGCRPDLFYSHRKQGPRTGRSIAAVAKAGESQ